MKTSEILESTAVVAMFPGWWTTKALSRNSAGERVSLDDVAACSFCAIGLIAAVVCLSLGVVKQIMR